MKILLICSNRFYSVVPYIKEELENDGHDVTVPNGYNNNYDENIMDDVESVLVLNFNKDDKKKYPKDHIGEETFLEMYDAFRLNKKIYLVNGVPEGELKEKIELLNPIELNGFLNKLNNNVKTLKKN